MSSGTNLTDDIYRLYYFFEFKINSTQTEIAHDIKALQYNYKNVN